MLEHGGRPVMCVDSTSKKARQSEAFRASFPGEHARYRPGPNRGAGPVLQADVLAPLEESQGGGEREAPGEQ